MRSSFLYCRRNEDQTHTMDACFLLRIWDPKLLCLILSFCFQEGFAFIFVSSAVQTPLNAEATYSLRWKIVRMRRQLKSCDEISRHWFEMS